MNMTKVKPSIANTSLNAGRRRFPLTLWVVVLLVLLLLSVLSSITFGPVDIAIPDVARILVCRCLLYTSRLDTAVDFPMPPFP